MDDYEIPSLSGCLTLRFMHLDLCNLVCTDSQWWALQDKQCGLLNHAWEFYRKTSTRHFAK
ncbi:hypothetical protein A0J61_06454 [Choanephora cucurbitarum]|uniref:Uncharacterized protein n=1 Tax=Choanephora cucurbitarum TaxID=101091 RepID=A0A1C7N9Z8_9FUNG|nr:hypothetical protein A0J61_06454 [Choanephora cucurbitarum]